MSLVNYRPSESPVAQMSVVAGLVASTAQALSLSFQEKSVLLRICQSFGSSVTYDVYRSVDGVVDSDPMVSGVSDAFYLSVILGQENSILVLSLRAAGYYPILLTVSYLYEKDLLFISQVGAIGEMKYKTFNSTELSQNLDYTIDSFTAVPDLSIDTLPKVIDFLSGFVTTDNLKQYIADQIDVFEIVQGPGSSTTAVMSQNAVTEELRKKASMESVTESISAHNTSTTAHADIRELLNTCVGLPAYDSSSYKITFTTLAGATVEIDLPIEQLALRYNAETDSIEFDNADGTTTSIPVSAFVKEYVGSIGDRIQVSIDENNVIHATILKNSIDWDCLSFELQERINDHVTSADFATKAVRTDITQTLTTAQQSQAFANLGWKVHVISESAIGSSDAVSDNEKSARLSATALLVQETGEMYIYGHNSSSTPSDRRFYRFRDTKTLGLLNVVTTTGLITTTPFINIYDENAVSFNIDQSNVSDDNKNKALGNIGIDLVRLPYSLLGTTLSDGMANVINNARGIILVDTPNDFILPTIYNKGRTTSTNAKFIAIGEVKDVYYISYNKNTKALAAIVHDYTDNGCVRYVQEQSLTDTQKDTVLSNIGLNWIHVQYSLLNTTLDDATYTKLTNAYGIILTDAPSEYYGPLEFICSANNSDGTKVFAGLNLANTSAYIVLYVNHNLTNVRYARTYDGAVPYDASKTLTSAQQDVALSNIGLDFVHVDYSLLGTTLTDEMFAVIDNAKGIILVDIPSDYRNPTVFVKGNNISGSCIFVAFVTGNTYCIFTLNKSTKLLSGISSGLSYGGSVRYAEEQSLTDAQKEQARTNIGAARDQDIQNITGSAPTLSIVGGVTYVCGELTTLTVNSIEDSTDESWVYFTSGSTPTVVTWPTGANIAGDTTIVPNVSYEVCIRNSRIIIVYYEQS